MQAARDRNVAGTIFRPTLIYGTGRDRSLAPIARFARRWRVLPLPVGARGLRQPVHAAVDDILDVLLHRLPCRVLRTETPLDVTLDALDNYDRVIHNKSDGQHESEHRQCVDRETEQRKEDERAHERDGHSEQRDERGSPVLQEKVNHKDHQRDRDDQGLENFLHPLRNRLRLVQRYGVVDIFWEALFHLRHQLAPACHGLNGVRAR